MATEEKPDHDQPWSSNIFNKLMQDQLIPKIVFELIDPTLEHTAKGTDGQEYQPNSG